MDFIYKIRAIREMQFICNHLAQKLGTTQFKQMNYESRFELRMLHFIPLICCIVVCVRLPSNDCFMNVHLRGRTDNT